MFRHLSPGMKEGAAFRVYPVFLNVGINAEAWASQVVGGDQLEREINADGLRDISTHFLPKWLL